MIDIGLAGPCGGGHVFEDRLDRLGRWQRGHDDLGALSDFTRGASGGSALRGERVDGAARTVEHVDSVASSEQPLSHGSAHLAEADEA